MLVFICLGFGGFFYFFFMFRIGLETAFVSAKRAEKYYVVRMEAGTDYSFAHL